MDKQVAAAGNGGGGDIPTDRLLTLEQVCLLAGGVSKSSVRRAVRGGKFPAPKALFGQTQIQRFCPIETRRALGLPVPGEAQPGRGK